MLPALGEHTRVAQYKLQALGDTDGPVSRLGAGLDSRGPEAALVGGEGLGVGGDLLTQPEAQGPKRLAPWALEGR